MSQGETKPATSWSSITPSDSTDITFRALWINSGGNITLRDSQGNDELFTVVDSTLLPIQPKRVMATGTTATGIIGLN
ncbi:spike base protein, RCAP_Rcc01079 family [Pseudoalteromonas marina]|uniref:spike base protein, RCAP_Rcc01079 family n=1 Tax=Pseudoalteromonas marina TaxID=267375 RepID=UPI003C48EC1D